VKTADATLTIANATLTIALTALMGCGGSGPADMAAVDMAMPDLANPYPAPHPPMPQAKTEMGPVAASPKFLAISFPNDPLVNSIDDFVSKIAVSKYWLGAVSEYQVGAATALPPIHSAYMPPQQMTDLQLQQWLTSQIKMGQGFPTPDANTIYTIFLPDGVSVSLGGGVSCQDFGAYHNDYAYNNLFVTYVVAPRCPPPTQGVTVLDELTAAVSHEFVEAATDPLAADTPAWTDVDPDHAVWALVGGGSELGDLCAAFPDSFYRPADLPYLVQRTWSNAAAAAGHDPCEPDGAKPYFNSSPVFPDTVTAFIPGQGTVDTKGVLIPVGQSKTIELDLYSDAPTSGAWSIKGVDFASAFMGQPRELSFTFDKTSGMNGDKVMMTITAVRGNNAGTSAFWIQNNLGATSTVWLGLVTNQ